MSTYKLTPQQAKARAQALAAKKKAAAASKAKTGAYNASSAASVAQRNNTNALLRSAATLGDATANVLKGALKGLEGIYDFTTGLGAVGSLLTGGLATTIAKGITGATVENYSDKIKEHIEYDIVGEGLGFNKLDEFLDESSYIEEWGKAGEITESVLQGVGQMLPSVAVSVATAGAGAPAAAAQAMSLTTTGISAAGSSTEEAYKDGAGYGQGLLYGTASGLVEAGTEKLTGGLTKGLFGGGMLDNVTKSLAKETAEAGAKVGAKRVVKGMLEESAEEAMAELASPALKAIYKGKDAFSEYGESEYWQGVGESALVGGLTSAVYGGTVGKIKKLGGSTAIESDAREVADDIEYQTERMRKLEENGNLTPEREAQIKKTIKADVELFSKQLQKTSADKRAEVIKNSPVFSSLFAEDGTVSAEASQRMDSAIKAATDTSHGLDHRYYSESARGRENEIIEGLAKQGTKVVSGELSAEEKKAYTALKKAHGKLRALGFVNTDLVLAESMTADNAYLDGKTIVIGRDSLTNGQYIKALVHETTHFAEGTQEWLDVTNYVFGKDGSSVTDLIERVKNSGYGVTQDDVDKVLSAVKAGNLADTEFTEAQRTLVSEVVAMKMEEIFADERSVERLVNDNPSLAKRVWERIKTLVESLGRSKEERQQLAELRKTEEMFRKALENAGVEYLEGERKKTAARKITNSMSNKENVIDLSNDSELSNILKDVHGAEKYKKLQEYILEALDGKEIILSDGKTTIVDKSDALHIANRSGTEKTAQISKIKEIIQKAELYAEDKNVEHNKFNYFCYYKANVKFKDETFSIFLNVGKAKNDGTYHIYDITKKLRDTANRINGLERPKPNEGYALKNDISSNSISQTEEKSTPSDKKSSFNIKRSAKFDTSSDRVTVTKGELAKLKANYKGEKQFNKKDVEAALGKAFANHEAIVKDENGLDNAAESVYNHSDDLYTSTDTFTKDVSPEDRSSFSRSLANKTTGMKAGETRNISIICASRIYFFEATGYMSGNMYRTVSSKQKNTIYDIRKIWENGSNTNIDSIDSLVDAFAVERRRTDINSSIIGDRRGTNSSHGLSLREQDSYTRRDNERGGTNYQIDLEESKQLIKELRKLYGTDNSNIKHSHKATSDSDTVTVSRGQLAKLKANYKGEKQFNKKDVEAALGKIEALKILSKTDRDELVSKLFQGYNVHLDAAGYEIFSEIMYEQIHARILQESDFELSREEMRVIDEQIVKALREIVASGHDTIKAKLEYSVSQDGLKKQADFWREEYKKATEQIKIRGRILSVAQKIKDLKTGAYVNASRYKSDTFKDTVEKLARIRFRGNMNVTGTRGIIKGLNEWYDDKQNALYSPANADSGVAGRFDSEIKDMMTQIADGSGDFTTEELLKIEKIVSYFVGEIETYNTVLRNGKRVEAKPLAESYIEKAKQARTVQLKCGVFRALSRNNFARMVADPATLMRQADGYMNGFFTEMFEEMRRGEIASAVHEMELTREFQEFWKKNKAYRKHYNESKIEINGHDVPLSYAISLYMTYQRKHAQAGLVLSGFDILDGDKKTTVYRGTDEQLTQKQIEKIAKERAAEIRSKLTDKDMEFISIMERAFEECRKLKIDVDMMLKHYTNVDNTDYYFPIRCSQIALNVDMFSMFEGDRVSNLSMNKDTVKGAKNALLIEPVDVVFMRHIKATSLYAGLGVFTDNFNRLYNLNVNGIQEDKSPFFKRDDVANPFNTDGKSLNTQLQEAFDTSSSKDRRYVYVGNFTQGFIDKLSSHIDIKNLPIVMNYRDAYLSMQSKENGKYQGDGVNYHNLGIKGLESALLSFENPQCVLLSPKAGKIELILQGKDYKNRDLISIIEVNTKTQNNGKFMDAHVVTSVYGNKTIQNRIEKARAENRLIYQKEESTQGMAQVQYKSDINANSSNNRVSQNLDFVNTSPQKINDNRPETIKSTLEADKFPKAMIDYFTEIKKDIEGISTKERSTQFFNDAVRFIRSNYAKYQLGANPKVWLTQLSSFFSASNLLDYSSMVKGFKAKNKFKDVDKYCRLARLRNVDDMAVKAQAVTDKIGKIGDFLMTPIGAMDRGVVVSLFGACQVQVAKDQKLAMGTEENKKAAGELLQKVILETQQNSLASERSAAMRTNNDLLKSFTMFSADAMKVFSRFVDAFGEREVLNTLIKNESDSTKKAEYQKRLEQVNKMCGKSISAIVMTSVFTSAIALLFKWWYRRDEEESFGTFCADVFGNMIGGIPFIRDIYSFFADGYEMDNFMMSTFNDVMSASLDSFKLIGDAVSGKDVSEQDVVRSIRDVLYAAGQLTGIPVRNTYNFITGNINRFIPSAGYKIDSMFYNQTYSTDLAKAIENEDEDMISTIAGLMLNENVGGIESEAARRELDRLVTKGYDVIPRGVSDTVTYDGETYELTKRDKKAFSKIYNIANESLADMVKLARYKEADDEIKAKAIRFVYQTYYQLALQDYLGEDFENKTVLFAEAIDIEKLALIVCTARSLSADTDKNGKAVSGSRKRKIQAYIGSLRLSAAEKYMVMGYLGYVNINGESLVKAHINKLNLTKAEKSRLLEYSGYVA